MPLGAALTLINPTGTFTPEPNQTAAQQTHGVYNGAPTLSIWSIWSIRSIGKRHAPARCAPPLPSNAPRYPPAYFRPRPHSAVANPRGIQWRTHIVHLVHLVHWQAPRPRNMRATVAIKRPALPTGIFLPAPPTAPWQTHGVYRGST